MADDKWIPPHMSASIDQQDALLRNLADKALTDYREHVDRDHGGEPSHCAQAVLVLGFMGMRIDPEQLALVPHEDALQQEIAYGLIAYLVERLYVGQLDASKAAAEILTVSEELRALKARIEAAQ
ncbi:hypothetical protein [Mycolicibacterium senegalense]|uniref:Uncharacterized protein n=1 Tax=Mycolicibacterium senegalense TaxID=1796 RepID=A0ABR5G1Q8_9MYCO|nr:hypothetical protein [Mycolicibacterium senegalense]KLI05820.1 hypothetical protein AA982_23015 [Mycolicibacterium senegalense]KLO54104.1 hypothetical protein ABW05_24185 [Mycolicibacterium senegalense]KLO54169.1 hypothetical protein ABW05_24610 [Mycolicibacterium senegalense]